MDFAYTTIAFLLLLMHGCIGQDDSGGDASPGETLGFEVSILPARDYMMEDLHEDVVFTCEVIFSTNENRDTKPVYEWLLDDQPIVSTKRVYTEERPTSLMLRLFNVTDGDSGEYKCTATYQGQSDSKSIRLEVVKPLLIKSPANQHGIKGTDGEVMCDVSGKPAPTISWKFPNGSYITNTPGKFIIQANKLIVKDLDFDDDGTYLCDIIVRTTGESKLLSIKYRVVELPEIELSPTIEPNNPTVGDEVKIHCTATGVPKPTYDFRKDGAVITEAQIDAVKGILTIPELKRNDEATYTCIASNIGGSVEKTNTLDVKIPPVIKEIPDVGEAVEEGLQEIVCEAEGDPAPDVAWRKKGMESDYSLTEEHPKISIEDSSDSKAEIKVVKVTLVFNPVKAQDAGDYVCTATNIVGSVQQEVKMAVQYAPHFDVDYDVDTFYGWNGHQANLTCQASANSLASITWKRPSAADQTKEEAIVSESPFTIRSLVREEEKHLSTSSLMVTIGSDKSLYGIYICEASNSRGDAKRTVTLKEATPPQQPQVSVSKTLSTVATLSVTKPSVDGGQAVTGYSYTYRKDGGPDSEAQTKDIEGDETTIKLKGLSPSTSYVVNLSAVNAVGPGTSTELSFETLKVSKPQKLVVKSLPLGQEATTYNLRWAEPDDGGSAITTFIIKYKQVTVNGDKPEEWTVASDVDKEFTVKEVKGNSARSYTLRDLSRDSYYEVEVTATNKEGTSDPERWIIKTIKGNAGSTADSASMGSGLVIGVIIVIIIVLLVIVLAVYFVTKKRRAAGRGDVEGGKADAGKEAAEEEKLIQKDNAKTENESDKKEDGIEETQEFEPDEKPTPPAAAETAGDPAQDGPQTEPTIQITPETPEKPENPSA